MCVLLSDLESVDSAVQTLSVCWRSSQAFNLIPQPVLSCFMLLHQLSALPLRHDALLQVSYCILRTTVFAVVVSQIKSFIFVILFLKGRLRGKTMEWEGRSSCSFGQGRKKNDDLVVVCAKQPNSRISL